MAFLKSLGAALYERVVIHYKPTLIGIGLAAGIVVVDQTTTLLTGLPAGWAKYAAVIVAAIGAFLRAKQAQPPKPEAVP